MKIIEAFPCSILETRPPSIRNTGQGISFPLLPCSTVSESGGEGVTRNRHSMGRIAGTVTLNYDMYSIPDSLDIYYAGIIVATTGGPVSGTGTLTFSYNPLPDGPFFITVIVIGPSGTAWQYSLSCPVPP